MNRLRDNSDDFAGAITQAAERLGLAPAFVEKDYWVTQALRALHTHHPGAFVFKGGTSLSKGYGLIERFSEDVDILVTPTRDDSATARERLLQTMTDQVARDLDANLLLARKPGRGKMPHRADLISYPHLVRSSIPVIEDRGVLLETGFAGGDWPSEMVQLTPMLCEPLALDPAAYADTTAFQVRALKPVRTLIEKISLLHHAATRYAGNGSADQRVGRHYYDIYKLLEHKPTRTALHDRAQFGLILAGTETISTRFYNSWTARPRDGYATSPAFAPPHGSDLRNWLQARYNDAATLMPAHTSGRWPSFGEVLKRVNQNAELL